MFFRRRRGTAREERFLNRGSTSEPCVLDHSSPCETKLTTCTGRVWPSPVHRPIRCSEHRRVPWQKIEVDQRPKRDNWQVQPHAARVRREEKHLHWRRSQGSGHQGSRRLGPVHAAVETTVRTPRPSDALESVRPPRSH